MQRFNYHTHTYRCGHADLDYTDEEYVQDFIKMGFQSMAFTDHCPVQYWGDGKIQLQMVGQQRKAYLESIRSLKEKYAGVIEIQSGYEVEYVPGQQAHLLALRAEVDKFVLGQHFICDEQHNIKPFRIGRPFAPEEFLRYARHIKDAMALHLPDIIAHPDVYMLSAESFGEAEAETAHILCRAAQEYQIPLEINLNKIFCRTYYHDKCLNHDPMSVQIPRLAQVRYPCRDFWQIAAEYDVKVLYGIDVHYRGEIPMWQELKTLAGEIIGKKTLEKLTFIDGDRF